MPSRLLVIGAGPIGIAAALSAIDRGHEVTVLEKRRVGNALLTWGHTRFFTPLHMNVTPRMLEMLGADGPDRDALLTGSEMIDRVLKPLASRAPLLGRIREHARVIAIGRRGLTRSDYAGHPLRSERPFKIVFSTGEREEAIEADVVMDATGGYASPNPIGAGGLPVPGESRLIGPIRTLGALTDRLDSLRGRHTLLVGHGHSAANALNALQTIAQQDQTTRVTWAVRSLNRRPCEEIAGDPLGERQRVVANANALAEDPPQFLKIERRAMVESVQQRETSVEVTLSGGRVVSCDAIAAFTGYHPNGSIHSELAVDTSPVTEGTARLYRAIANVTDCLTVPRVALSDLQSGEPNFWFIGSRSYGRARTFLLQTGLAQVETILESLR